MTGIGAGSAGDMHERVLGLSARMSANLHHNILPFWLALEDREFGAHHGLVDAQGRIDPQAPKGAIFVSRLLWTLSRVGAALGREVCLEQASRAKHFLMRHVLDRADGGLMWSVTRSGAPLDTTKHLYAQAFGIYGLSAFANVTGDREALGAARGLFEIVEQRRPRPGVGAGEAFDRAWRPTGNRLARDGRASTITANTHLHLIEAYTGLVIAWPDARPVAALADLLDTFVAYFLAAEGGYSYEALDDATRPLPGRISYGHDAELSWLLEAAGHALGDAARSSRLSAISDRLICHAAAQGQDADGGWSTDHRLRGRGDRLWWVQAEAMLGLVGAAARTGDHAMLARAEATWDFIEQSIVDRARGDWHAQVDRSGRPDPRGLKASIWKDPYHQARACLMVANLSANISNAPRLGFL